MFKHVLVAVDGSEAGQAAFETAVELSKELRASLTALHVGDASNGALPWLEDFRKRGDAKGVQTEVLVREGAASEVIREATETMRWDVLVIGTHGRQGVQRMMLGSVAQDVLHRSNIPVLIVRRDK